MVSTSIVIPLYGGLEFTRACHAALRVTLAGRDDVEIIYVDNASPDDTATWLDTIGDEATVVSCESNRNFSGGCNLGVAAARAERIVLLNNDTEPQAGWLEALDRALDDERVGVAGALLTYPDGSVQHAGVAFPPGKLPEHIHVGAAVDDPRVSRPRDLQAVTAACLALRRATWELLGGLDEGYVNGMEDMDLCLRVRDAGLRVRYEPAARIVHHESRTDGRFRHASANIQRFVQQHGSALVPDAQVFDALADLPSTDALHVPDLVPAHHPRGFDNAALRTVVDGLVLVAGSQVDRIDASVRDIEVDMVATGGAADDAWLVAHAELVARVGGFDLALPTDVRRADWIDRVRLCGGRVVTADRAAAATPWSSSALDHPVAQRRWGVCAPDRRLVVDYEPLTDVVQARDAVVELTTLEHGVLVSIADPTLLEAGAGALFRNLSGSSDTSVVIRVSAGDEAAFAALERAANAQGDAELPDVVVAESGPETQLALAQACTSVMVCGAPDERMRLASLARAARRPTLELDLSVSARRS